MNASSTRSIVASVLPAQDPARTLTVTVKPLVNSADDEIGAVEVHLALTGVRAGPDDPLLEMVHLYANVRTAINCIEELDARDDSGPLRLSAHDSETNGQRFRQWSVDRSVIGTVHVRYRVQVASMPPARGPAPPLELRSEAGALSGAGMSFLMLPLTGSFETAIHWDLSALPTEARAVSSLGEGDRKFAQPVPAKHLERVFFMAGKIELGVCSAPRAVFFSAWQGTPPFDAQALMTWTETLYTRYSEFFGANPLSYGVFLRRNIVNPGGGMALIDSFVATFDDIRGNDPEDLKITLSHEMFHTFQPYLAAREGQEPGLETAWFNEGLAVFYQSRLPLRFGMIARADFLADLNYHAGRYYTNALANLPDSEVPKRFWEDTRVRTLPYDRGLLYMVQIDDQIRKASRGQRSLDDVLFELLARRRRAKSLLLVDWEAVLAAELGPDAVAAFHAMLDGESPLPASDAFGRDFHRVEKPLRRYELGFEPKVLMEEPRVVRGLIRGSNAEAAGLRDGDEILRSVGQDGIQGQQEAELELAIRRASEYLQIRYRPRGELVSAWQWCETDLPR